MSYRRMDQQGIDRLLADWPRWASELALELREFVLGVAPTLVEGAALNSIAYRVPGRRGGVIGGNVCLIGLRGDCVHLAFVHGAGLPDPDGLLLGKAKAKRYIELRGASDIRRRAFGKLIRAAIAYQPEHA